MDNSKIPTVFNEQLSIQVGEIFIAMSVLGCDSIGLKLTGAMTGVHFWAHFWAHFRCKIHLGDV